MGEDGDSITINDLGMPLPTAIKQKFIKRRKGLIKPYKDQKRSSSAKEAWRHSRYNHLKGIREFAKSVMGKRFHRKLADFIVNREPRTESLDKFELSELVSLLSSYKTHAVLDLQYYKPLNEEADFLNALESTVEIIDNYTKELLETCYSYDDYPITEELYESIFNLLETNAVLHVFAEKSGKPQAIVDNVWEKAKDKTLMEKSEDDGGFYSLVIGETKKLLGLGGSNGN